MAVRPLRGVRRRGRGHWEGILDPRPALRDEEAAAGWNGSASIVIHGVRARSSPHPSKGLICYPFADHLFAPAWFQRLQCYHSPAIFSSANCRICPP